MSKTRTMCDCYDCKMCLELVKANTRQGQAAALRGLAKMSTILGRVRCTLQRLEWAEELEKEEAKEQRSKDDA